MTPKVILGLAAGAGLAAAMLWPSEGSGAAVAGGVWPLRLRNAPFPEQPHPGAVLVVPPGYDPRLPLRVVVYFRGFSNCVTNVVGNVPGPCVPGGTTHNASNLAGQLAASGSNTLLIAPELRYEARSSDAGTLARDGGFVMMMEEILGEHLPASIGPRRYADVAHLGLMSHSGGYGASAAVIQQRPPSLRSVALLDSLYALDGVFAGWIDREAVRLSPSGGCRFASIYTDTGGTDALSRSLSARVRPAGPVLRDTTTDTLTPEQYERNPVIFKRSALAHDAVARYYPQRLWAAGW